MKITKNKCKYCKTIFFREYRTPDYCSKSCATKWRIENTNWKPTRKYGEQQKQWKGDNVGYRALHHWVYNHLGRPDKCEHCLKTGLKGRSIHWASLSRKYKRDLKDWIRLCSKCHGAFDTGTRNHTMDKFSNQNPLRYVS